MKRCMIVDGSNVIRKVARRILEGPDMIIVDASHGDEALAMCTAQMPDIILVDNNLPDMAGVDFIRSVTAIDASCKPDILLSMTQLDIGTIMRAKRAGAKGYMLKPFNRPQLLERFRQMELAAA
ncbi:response regulator [Chelativorans sp. ZYF759]|uniref:response regulator n=1 Tax=Chelativorans sp. ZYF759 TaxID=2692213 RepID=UPI00145D4E3D|nr:response regulator [Chelativorans sp. ZYF759]NMG40269.1 response regulator [Chelativorans sp. ZYF759]